MIYDENIQVELAVRSAAAEGEKEPQENLSTLRTRHGDLIVLADGLGDRRQSRRASRLVVDTIVDLYRNWDGHHPRQMLIDAIGLANSAVREEAAQNPELEGMSSTVAVLHFGKNMVRFAHVGNSRVYRQRGNLIDQMTRDHTEAQRLADNGLLPQEEVEKHPKAGVLYKAVGAEDIVSVDVSDTFLVEPNDAYVIVSDGLIDALSDADIGREIMRRKTQDACNAIIHLARLAGSVDDLSLAIIRFKAPPVQAQHFTAGLAGPPTIQHATSRHVLPSPQWHRLTTWWKVRLIALGALVLWFVVLLILWWLIGPKPAATTAAVWPIFALSPVRSSFIRRLFRRRRHRGGE